MKAPFWTAVLLIALGVILFPGPAYALEDDCDRDTVGDTMCDWLNDTWGSGTGSTGGGTTTTLCTKTYCSQCGLDANQTASVCYTLYGSYGYCTCSGTNTVIDKGGGVKYPRCNTSGSCRFRR